TIFNLFTEFDSLVYNGKTFVDTQAEITASKISDSTAVLAMATITSAQQSLTPKLKTKNLLVEGIWNKNHIDFSLDADQEGETNYVRLKGGLDFLKDSTVIAMDSSDVKLLERDWRFADNNYVIIKDAQWIFNHLSLFTGQQSIELNGSLSHDPAQRLTMKVNEFDLSTFNVLTDKKIAGIMNAQISLSNYFKQPNIENSVAI